MSLRTILGFALINGFTFGVDLSCLSLLHGVLGWPVPAAVTLSYVLAFALSFWLNRRYNFRSHGEVSGQLTRYVAVVTINYLAWILGLTTGLTALGMDYRLARITAGAAEGIYMYCAMRWLIFRDTLRAPTCDEPISAVHRIGES